MIAEMIKPALGRSESKPALGSSLPDCPSTKWKADDIDAAEWQAKYRSEELPECPLEIVASEADNALGAEYFVQRRDELAELLARHGTLWLRGFDLTKDPAGFRAFWESLDLDPCLDPIHSSGLRKFLSKRDAIYEEVNKQSLSQHYIGLHQEMTEKKTAKAGAFVCFQPATISGGEFLIADGERIFRDLDTAALQTLMERKVRISVSNLDLDVLGLLPGATKDDAMESVRQLVGDTVAPKFDMDLDMIWGTDGKAMRLQAIEHAQSPVNRHPDTGRPVWFCNMHNHARFLRERRCCAVPEVGMTDVFFGDLSIIPGELLAKVNDACEKNIVRVPMEAGDVLLCDNYRVLHGRDVFRGERQHAVSWFGDEAGGPAAENRNDGLAGFINQFVVGE
jgi:alpha-ketoglutarate-dependent taurine dioxygenase